MAAEKEGNEFIRLRGEDESFQRRSNFVFASLGDLEPRTEEWGDLGQERREQRRGNRSSHLQRVGRNARRRLPARVPDHVLSPEKWTEYSLKVDGSEVFRGMSEHNLNRHAAHSFLQNLRKRKAEEIEVKDSHESETKISFKKPCAVKERVPSFELKGAWKDGTFVMPEYHAGVNRAKARGSGKRSGVTSSAGCAKVSLGHLREDCEDEDPEEESGKNHVFKKRMKEKVKEDVKKMVDKEDCEKNEEGKKEESGGEGK